MSLFGGKKLKLNQKVRADFQINDADDGKERTGLLHWNCAEDTTYANPSGWGDGKYQGQQVRQRSRIELRYRNIRRRT